MYTCPLGTIKGVLFPRRRMSCVERHSDPLVNRLACTLVSCDNPEWAVPTSPPLVPLGADKTVHVIRARRARRPPRGAECRSLLAMGVAQSSLRDCVHKRSTQPALGLPFYPSECLSGSIPPASILTIARSAHGEMRMLDVRGRLRFLCKGLGNASELKCNPKPFTICDAMPMGEPLCVVERVQIILAAGDA